MTNDELIRKAKSELRCRHNGGKLTWPQFHDKHGDPNHTHDATRKQVERGIARRNKCNGSHAAPTTAPVTPPPKRKTMEQVIAEAIADYMENAGAETEKLEPPPPPKPTSTDDAEAWQQWKKEHPEIKALFLYDLHIPDHNEQAVKLAVKLAGVVKPNLIIFGGDNMDFPAFSHFQSTERPHMVDAFQEIQPVWDSLIDNLKEAAPEAVIVALGGNHEARLFKFMAEHWQLYDTLQGVFADLMRSRGRVWWLGGAQQTSIGDLLVKHGRRWSVNTARINLDTIGGGASIIQGHSHKPSLVVKKVLRADGTYRVLYSAVAPCLCNAPPWYNKYTGEAWLHGVAVGHIGENVNLQNIVFAPTSSGGLECWYGGEHVEVAG